MKVLITGATGFIGKNLAKRCLAEGFEVVCGGRAIGKLDSFQDSMKTVYLDILDRERLAEIFNEEKPDVVFHCAAYTKNTSIQALRKINVEGTRNVLDACMDAKIQKVIYLSSISVISGNPGVDLSDSSSYAPLGTYGQSKIEAERLAVSYRDKGLKIAIIRPTLVYGEDDSHWLFLVVSLLRFRVLPIVGDGANRYPLVYIQNLLDVMMLAVFNDAAYEGTYIVSDKEAVTIKELFCYISKICGFRSPIQWPRFWATIISCFPFPKSRSRIFTIDKICNINRLEKSLGYTPKVSFYEGMQRSLAAAIMHRRNNPL